MWPNGLKRYLKSDCLPKLALSISASGCAQKKVSYVVSPKNGK